MDTSATGKFQSSCQDLRFTNTGGKPLPYYIDSGCGSSDTIIHVKFDTFPSGAQTIYMYYGNSSAANGTESSDFTTEAASYTFGTLATEEQGPGPVGYWKFDDPSASSGQVAKGSSSSKNDGTITGATWTTEDQYMIVDGQATNVFSLLIDATTKMVVFGTYDGTLDTLSGGVLDENTWYHVAITYNNGAKNIYVNGILKGSSTRASSNPVIKAFGMNTDEGATYYWPLKGSLDQVRIFNYVRTAAQIKADYNSRGASKGTSVQIGPQSKALSDGLVGYWKMDESSGTLSDSSGNSNTGTWYGTGAKHWDVGKVGSGGKFNGTDDYVDATMGSVSTETIETWIKLNAYPSAGKTFGVAAHAAAQGAVGNFDKILYVGENGKAGFYVWTTGAVYVLGTRTLSLGVWYHLVGTVGATGTKIYVNGINENTNASATYSWTGGTHFYTSFDNTGYTNSDFFNGFIDQVRVYNYARSAAQIAWDYNQGKPVGHWKFDECQGSVAHDSSSNSNHGTITIGASGEDTLGTCTTSSTAWGSGATGKYNSSLSFDGTDDYVSISDTSFPTGTQPRTISSWVKTSSSTLEEIISYGTGSSSQAFTVGIWGSSGIFVSAWASPQYTVTATANNGVWHHVAVSYDGVNASTYMDGVLLDTRSFSINTVANTGKIGARRDAGAELFNGQIDDVKIFNYALTPLQIKNLYNNGAVFFGPVSGSP